MVGVIDGIAEGSSDGCMVGDALQNEGKIVLSWTNK